MASKFQGEGAAAGATSGALAGSAAGPWGALAGGVAGGLLGGFSSKGKTDPNYAVNELAQQRQRDISYFAADLAKARQQYIANLNNLQSLTYAKFAPMAESQFASRGLEVTGGSFQAALARRAADLQAQGQLAASEGQIQDLNTVQQLRAGAFGAQLGAQQPMTQQQSPMGGLLGQLGSAGLTALLNRAGQRPIAGSQSYAQPSQFNYQTRSPVSRSTSLNTGTNPFFPR